MMFPPLGKILIWHLNASPLAFFGTSDLKALCENLIGIGEVNTADDWTGDLNDYSLIYWPAATSNPSWWGAVESGSWSGRLHITAEWSLFFDTIDYVNSKSLLTGIAVVADDSGSGCHLGTVAPSELTAGLSEIGYGQTSQVSGGEVLSRTTAGLPWLARNKVGEIDFVIAGDSNHMTDGCCHVLGVNRLLFTNFWEIDI